MAPNLDGKTFTSISNTANGEVDENTVFYYHQEGNIVWAEYKGGAIIKGHLIGKIIHDGKLDMRYHHINNFGELMIGKCISTPIKLPDGRLKLQEEWQWLSGNNTSGQSEIIEIVVKKGRP